MGIIGVLGRRILCGAKGGVGRLRAQREDVGGVGKARTGIPDGVYEAWGRPHREGIAEAEGRILRYGDDVLGCQNSVLVRVLAHHDTEQPDRAQTNRRIPFERY